MPSKDKKEKKTKKNALNFSFIFHLIIYPILISVRKN